VDKESSRFKDWEQNPSISPFMKRGIKGIENIGSYRRYGCYRINKNLTLTYGGLSRD